MIIYSAGDRTPYTYLVGWSHLNQYYYGRRTGKGCHPAEFWVSYFTSSKYVRELRLHYGDPNIIQIRKTFTSTKTCAEWEVKVLRRVGAVKSKHWLNRSYALGKYDASIDDANLFTHVKDKDGKRYRVRLDDSRIKTGELVPAFKGLKSARIASTGKVISVDVNDIRFSTGELVPASKGRIPARVVSTGLCIQVQKDDMRFSTGELVPITTGKTTVKDKDGNIFKVSKDDPRIKSGELVGVTKGFLRVKDKHGNFYFVSKDDPRYISGEFIFWRSTFS